KWWTDRVNWGAGRRERGPDRRKGGTARRKWGTARRKWRTALRNWGTARGIGGGPREVALAGEVADTRGGPEVRVSRYARVHRTLPDPSARRPSPFSMRPRNPRTETLGPRGSLPRSSGASGSRSYTSLQAPVSR